LLDVQVMQEVAREGFEVIGCFHQPEHNCVGIGLEDPCNGADTEAFGERRDRPHQLVRIALLAVKHGAMGLQEMPLAAQTHQLAPPPAVGMAVGADIPPAHPAVIRTRGLGAEVAGGIDVSATASGADHTGWGCVGY
jgi:hypothetical protein